MATPPAAPVTSSYRRWRVSCQRTRASVPECREEEYVPRRHGGPVVRHRVHETGEATIPLRSADETARAMRYSAASHVSANRKSGMRSVFVDASEPKCDGVDVTQQARVNLAEVPVRPPMQHALG